MATLAFSFGGATRDRLSFHFPTTYVPGSPRVRNPRYAVSNRPSGIGLQRNARGVWIPPEPWSGIGTLRGPRYTLSNRPSGIGLLRNPRYTWIPAEPWSGIGLLRNPRHHQTGIPFPSSGRRRNARSVSPPTPFVGEIPPQNVRANVTASPATNSVSLDQASRIPWQAATEAMAHSRLPLRPSADFAAATRMPWGTTAPVGPTVRIELEPSDIAAPTIRSPLGRAVLEVQRCTPAWRDSTPFAVAWRIPFTRAILLTQTHRLPWREGRPLGQPLRHSASEARVIPALLAWRFPWQDSRVLAGFSWPWTMPGPLPIIPPRANLRFHFHPPRHPRLQFHFEREPAWIIPIQRSYAMHHVFDLVLLPDETSIPVSAVSISCDWEEWDWSMTATLAGPDAVDLLRPVVSQAIEVEARLDGYVWKFRLDQVSGSEAFAKTGGQTQWIGMAAILGPDVSLSTDGYDPDSKTARQLAEQELLGTTWQLDWPLDFPDWLVPARRFSYRQKTPIEVISAIVETAGGRILADPMESWIHVAPRYPVPIWEWATTEPDLVLPRSILKTLSWKPRVGKPWDAVFLGDGETVLTKVQRAGLPGVSMPDAPIIEALLCHLDACRARGIALLSDCAAGVDFTLELPLSTSSGVSPLRAVGELVRFVDGEKTWMGLITSVHLTIEFGKVTQKLEVRAVELP